MIMSKSFLFLWRYTLYIVFEGEQLCLYIPLKCLAYNECVTGGDSKKMLQNVTLCIQVTGIQRVTVLLLQLFWRLEIFHNKKV